jgi:hypothetical protein
LKGRPGAPDAAAGGTPRATSGSASPAWASESVAVTRSQWACQLTAPLGHCGTEWPARMPNSSHDKLLRLLDSTSIYY